MATPKIQIDNSQLLERMKRYQDVTGKEVGASMRRGARLLAVNLAYSVPPYGKDIQARKLGEKAVQNDILRVMRPMEKINLPFKSDTKSFKETVQEFVIENKRLRKRLLKVIKDFDIIAVSAISKNVKGFRLLNFIGTPDADLHKKVRNNYGRVRRGWKGRDVVFQSGSLENYIKQKQALVGFTKAAWASCAISVKADIQDALSGIPTWVKRHAASVPHNVMDGSDMLAPRITLTNKLPWADKALRKTDHEKAIRISREKFFKSLGTEIRYALKTAAAA